MEKVQVKTGNIFQVFPEIKIKFKNKQKNGTNVNAEVYNSRMMLNKLCDERELF